MLVAVNFAVENMKGSFYSLVGVLVLRLLGCGIAAGQVIPVPQNLDRLAAQEDTDGDQKITVHDRTTPFEIRDENGADMRTVTNEYQLSVLMQELKAAENRRRQTVSMEQLQLDENIVDRTHRFIKDRFWGRTHPAHRCGKYRPGSPRPQRRLPKYDFIYVPPADKTAVQYFKALENARNSRPHLQTLKVVTLPPPDKINGAFVRNLDGTHGILALALERNMAGENCRCAVRRSRRTFQ